MSKKIEFEIEVKNRRGLVNGLDMALIGSQFRIIAGTYEVSVRRRGKKEKDDTATPREIALARFGYSEAGIVEVDDDAKASRTKDGVWVQAWVWLSKEAVDG